MHGLGRARISAGFPLPGRFDHADLAPAAQSARLAARITELGSPSSDETPWVSGDERDIAFSSDRTGIHQTYESTR